MSDLAFNIVGVVLGAMGVVGVFQMGWSMIEFALPPQRFKVLDEVFGDTAELFQSVVEEGLAPDLSFIRKTENLLLRYRDQTENLRAKVHCATTFTQQVRGIFNGLSWAIIRLSAEVRKLRASISMVGEEERKRQGNQSRMGPSWSVSTSIRRPRSLMHQREQGQVASADAGTELQATTEDLLAVQQSLQTTDSSSPLRNVVEQLLHGTASVDGVHRLSREQVAVLLKTLTQLNDKVTSLAQVVTRSPPALAGPVGDQVSLAGASIHVDSDTSKKLQ